MVEGVGAEAGRQMVVVNMIAYRMIIKKGTIDVITWTCIVSDGSTGDSTVGV